MSSNLSKRVEEFFNSHENFLTSQYPGIKINRLMELFPKSSSGDYIALSKTSELQLIFDKLLKGIPLEYINGISFFYNAEFKVTKDVLIPRYETEILVEESVNFLKKENRKSLLDLGCGSGAIGLAILIESGLANKLTLSDISSEAIEVARKNSYRLGYNFHRECEIEFNLGDKFEGIKDSFDLIVTNPPYIKSEQHNDRVHRQTQAYEPHLALYLDDFVYESWFDNLFENTAKHLNPGGLFIMEGHEDEVEEQAKVLSKYLRNVEVINDLTNRPRFLKAWK